MAAELVLVCQDVVPSTGCNSGPVQSWWIPAQFVQSSQWVAHAMPPCGGHGAVTQFAPLVLLPAGECIQVASADLVTVSDVPASNYVFGGGVAFTPPVDEGSASGFFTGLDPATAGVLSAAVLSLWALAFVWKRASRMFFP